MNNLPTVILRHRRENLKKCSLRGLEKRSDFKFYTYPVDQIPTLDRYIMLDLSAPSLSEKDKGCGLFLIDATWKLAQVIYQQVSKKQTFIKRSLPNNWVTAYPRKQTACLNPNRGLASIEALFAAYLMLDKNPESLLDHYYWKKTFLQKNQQVINAHLKAKRNGKNS